MAERELYHNEYEEKIYEILDNSLIFHLPTIEFLIKKKDWEALNLFVVYVYFSKKQKNSKRVWVSNEFARKNMGWRKKKFLEVKRRLMEYGIIKVVPYKEKSPKSKGMVIKKWFVEIKPLLNAENILNAVKTSEVPETADLRGSHSSPLSNGNHSSIVITSLLCNSNNISLSKERESQDKTCDRPFSFKENLEKLLNCKQRHIRIIGLYFKHKGFVFDNKEQFQSAVSRNLRPARRLVGYSDEDILRTFEWLDEEEYLEKWTLETVEKYIDEVRKIRLEVQKELQRSQDEQNKL